MIDHHAINRTAEWQPNTPLEKYRQLLPDRWEEIDGEKRVTRINWKNKKLCGDISFAGLSELRKLVCSSDGLTGLLTGLDVRENTKLESLFCGGNQLTELDISKNMELYDLDCEINQLTELDLNNNPKLEYLYCNRNQLAKLDLSKNIELKYLACARNPQSY